MPQKLPHATSFWHFDSGTAKWYSRAACFGHNQFVRRYAATIERFSGHPSRFDTVESTEDGAGKRTLGRYDLHGNAYSIAITGETIFDTERLATAIDTRDRSYRLLMWINDAIDKNLILTSRAARHSGDPEAARDWLRNNYQGIPQDLRPDESEIGEFAACFSTYLTSSFDIKENPGTRGVGPFPVSACGCTCPICVRIVNAPHLQAKKLYTRDKQRARILMAERIAELAKENGIRISDEQVERIVLDANTQRAAAYLAYGHWLILRLAGESDGPSILALWRLIAWDPRGGVRRGFELKLEDFVKSEQLLLEAMQE